MLLGSQFFEEVFFSSCLPTFFLLRLRELRRAGAEKPAMLDEPGELFAECRILSLFFLLVWFFRTSETEMEYVD